MYVCICIYIYYIHKYIYIYIYIYIYTHVYILFAEFFVFGVAGFDFSVYFLVLIFGCIGVCPYMVIIAL